MPIRLRLFVAFLYALMTLAPAEERIIAGASDLKVLSANMPSPADRVLNIRIDNYVNPGQLRIDGSAGTLDTIRLQRFSPDSDGVITLDSSFIDAKNFAGTLVLKNLAFRLNPKAALIAGYDPSRPNHNLVLDSCYVYADTLDGAFLSWQGDTLSEVDIKNSWIVAAASKTGAASIQVSTGTATISNCLLNYAGTFTAFSITRKFEALSNTVNRVQFKLTGDVLGGVDPSYDFSQNLIAFHGGVNAFSGSDFYVMKASGFNENRSSILTNRMYSVWKGFDAPAGARGKTGVIIDSLWDGKQATELWDWYTEKNDPNTGILSGNSTLRRFNVLPGKIFVDTLVGQDSIRVNFKSALYPRAFRWNIGAPADLLDSAYRPLAVLPGRLSFGPFQVDNIRDNAIAEYGKPILLAQSAGGLFLPQASTSRVQEPRVFLNRSPAARVFALVDSGNTPRGFAVEPVLASAEKFEHIRFARVTGAGQTVLKAAQAESMPDSLRYLQRIFAFGTSATVNGQVTFASKPNATPWSGPGEGAWFWYWKAKDTLIPAVPGTLWGDSLLYGSFTYQAKDFIAYLVEKLSARAGLTTKTIPGASLLSGSAAGYQLHVDTTTVDSGRFGAASKGYRFAWTGRGANDSLVLILKAPAAAGAQVFVKVPSKADVDSLPIPIDTAGNYRIPIGPADSGKTFFAGVKYNVLAGTPFNGTVNGVAVSNLFSTTPGLLAYRGLSEAEAQKLGSNSATVFQNTRYLGGIMDASMGLNVAGDYTIALQAAKPSSDSTETWALEDGKWINISSVANLFGGLDHVLIRYSSQQPKPTHIVALERFQAPDAYFNPVLNPRSDSLIFSPGPHTVGATGPVVGYCLDIRSIGPDGLAGPSQCVKQDPATSTRVPILDKTAYAYRIIYYVGADTDTVALPQPMNYPTQFGWDVKDALKGNPELDSVPQGQWRLVALPAEGNLKQLLDSLPRTGNDTVRDTTMILDFKHSSVGKAEFDSAKSVESQIMGRARAILLASSHRLALSVNRLAAPPRKSLKPESVYTEAGWNLVGNPYPITLRKNCVKPQKPHVVRWWQLAYDGSPGNKYRWDTTNTTLPPFRGFAYYSAQPETLVIDPSDTAPPAPAIAKIAAGSGRIRVGIESPWGSSGMALVRGAGEYPIGYLPTPASALDLRVGGNGGFLIKPVGDFGRIDEPVEIRSDRDGVVRFALTEGAVPAFALIDEATGAVYDAASARELPVSRGSHSYRLLAGDAAFVGEGTQAFLAAAPSAIALSQNFPNPARGLTRIAIDWPATRARDRRATLEVLDLRGRRLAFRRLDGIQVGRQLIEVDASAWKPGIYIYRLSVVTGDKLTRLQKRMLVAP